MCPMCVANTAVMVAGVGSSAGVLALCIGKLRKIFGFGWFRTREK